MKHRIHLLGLIAVLALPPLARAQQPKLETRSAPAAAEAQVTALERAAHAALVRGDLAAFKEAVGGSFIFLNPSGTGPYTFEAAEAGFKACRTISSIPSNLQATTFGSDTPSPMGPGKNFNSVRGFPAPDPGLPEPAQTTWTFGS